MLELEEEVLGLRPAVVVGVGVAVAVGSCVPNTALARDSKGSDGC